MAIERFTWQIEKGATGDIKQRARSKQFGDGYEQSLMG
jgi:phage-related protein